MTAGASAGAYLLSTPVGLMPHTSEITRVRCQYLRLQSTQ